jgi:cobalt-zinc-cadmium resistance protein CzcA
MAIIIAALIPVLPQRVEGRISGRWRTHVLCAPGRWCADRHSRALRRRSVQRDAEVRSRSCSLTRGYERSLRGCSPESSCLPASWRWRHRLVAWRLGSEFPPELDEGDIVIFVEMPPSMALDRGG